jgi:hypothetical protein
MGIPKLWNFLSQTKLGERQVFPYHAISAGGKEDVAIEYAHLIFDGPSFAYWFWREASVRQGNSTSFSIDFR